MKSVRRAVSWKSVQRGLLNFYKLILFHNLSLNIRTIEQVNIRMTTKVRLLLIVREPVTRLISDFTQISHNRREKGLASRFIIYEL